MTILDTDTLVETLRSGIAVPAGMLRNAHLAGADLSGVDLSGADLYGADLSGAQLFKANLSGANLQAANLENAELTGADLTSANLSDVRARNAGLGMARLSGANLLNAELVNCTFSNADLSGVQARCAIFRDSRLPHARLCDAELIDADLRNTDLSLADITGATLTNADLRQACLQHIQGYRTADWIGADLREINFSGAYDLRRFAIDQNYINEFRQRNRACAIIYRVWSISSDCGRSFTLWFAWIAAVALLYAWLYTLVNVDFGTQATWLSPVYFSVVTMSTLGYGDVVPVSMAAQMVAMLQVITGYIMLGILLTLFNNKIARRGD